MRIIRFLLCAVAALPAFAAHAESYLTGEAGSYSFNDSPDSVYFGAEYRGNPFYYGFLPFGGVMIDSDADAYGYGGIAYDWEFVPRWHAMPSFAAGLYEHGSNGRPLGGPLEFREGIEVDYSFDNGWRAGARFQHMSNADIYGYNPGANSLVANLSFPLR